jgi:hypothetical protein
MTTPATNRPLFDQSEVKILERGLHTMSLACEALSKQNDTLNKDLVALKRKNSILEDKIITLT